MGYLRGSIILSDIYKMIRTKYNNFDFSALNQRFAAFLFSIVVIALVSARPNPALAESCNLSPMDYRGVVALFDGSISADIRDTNIHNFLELALNYFGFRVEYVDIATVNEATIPADTAVILSWFHSPLPQGIEIARWRNNIATNCGYYPRQLVIGHHGMEHGGQGGQEEIFESIGLSDLGPEHSIGHRSEIAFADDSIVNYETPFLPGVGAYQFLKASEAAQSFLTIEPNAGGDHIDLITIAEGGAFVHDAATLEFDPTLQAHFWILNPFELIERTLGNETRPIPDTTTMFGRRVFFATVNPDGWTEPAPSRYFGEDIEIAGEVLLRRVVEAKPQIPLTIAALLGDFVPELSGTMADRGRQAAVEIYQHEHVEIASSGHDQVRNWQQVESPGSSGPTTDSASIEGEAVVSGAVRALSELFARSSEWVDHRKYAQIRFDFDKELSGALAAMAQFSPESDPATLFLWHTASRPTERALRATREAGARSLGGGRQSSHPELKILSSLRPQAARVGSELHVYDALARDSAFTDNWTGSAIGFHALQNTIEWTEAPRRLKPFHLSFSARSVLNFATRSAILHYLDMAESGQYFLATAADYIAAVEGFYAVNFQRDGDLRWIVQNRGGMHTLRFDHASKLSLDMRQSVGVLGAVRKSDALFVSLDPNVASPLVALIADDSKTGIHLDPRKIAIAKSNSHIFGMWHDQCRTGFSAVGTSPIRIDLVTPPNSKIEVEIAGDVQVISADEDGNALLMLPAGEVPDLIMSIDCGEG